VEGEALKAMVVRLGALQSSLFLPDRGEKDPRACERVQENGGFYGPWVDLP
jgi:hypothetical protein